MAILFNFCSSLFICVDIVTEAGKFENEGLSQDGPRPCSAGCSVCHVFGVCVIIDEHGPVEPRVEHPRPLNCKQLNPELNPCADQTQINVRAKHGITRK